MSEEYEVWVHPEMPTVSFLLYPDGTLMMRVYTKASKEERTKAGIISELLGLVIV